MKIVTDEPVRGRPPPRWYFALSGIERMRAVAHNLIPVQPLARLLGLRTTHVIPGAVTVAMPATGASAAFNDQIDSTPLMMAALDGASQTALAAGMTISPMRFVIDPLRPAWVRPGNLNWPRARGERQ